MPERARVEMMDYPSRNRSDTSRRREDCGQVLDRGHNLGIIKIDTTGQFAGGEPLQMLERSSSWWTLEWCCSRSRERKLWLQTPQVRLDSPPEVEMIIIFSVKFVWRGRRG